MSAKSTTQVILFTAWYFGSTGWSRFQTDVSTMQKSPRNICTKYRRKLTNLTAFLEIYLYLKNSVSDKPVKSFAKCAIHNLNLREFAKFVMLFMKE